jgi:hypothetical protein
MNVKLNKNELNRNWSMQLVFARQNNNFSKPNWLFASQKQFFEKTVKTAK